MKRILLRYIICLIIILNFGATAYAHLPPFLYPILENPRLFSPLILLVPAAPFIIYQRQTIKKIRKIIATIVFCTLIGLAVGLTSWNIYCDAKSNWSQMVTFW
jgi:hypothetical protein